ncbi:MAG: hypothetical protein IPO93_05425 [Actinobacteria bacterium]|nr:hypothetical protein [Actinomycetota bacterium]
MTTLFVGVVSHENSRFAVSQGRAGLAALLVDPLAERGISTTVRVNTEDAYDREALPIDGAMVKRSLDETLRLEAAWADYLRAGSPRRFTGAALDVTVHGLRWAKQTARFVRPWQSAERDDTAGVKLVRRLLNIELSHLSLLRDGVDRGADWVLVLEDDAATTDVGDCAEGLAGLMTDETNRPQYVNVSRSFTPAELGIEHLLTVVPGAAWAGSADRRVLSASRPVTNTVCAILYRGSFVERLVATMDALPLDPVVPIDWKLNVALMTMFEDGRLGAGDCWLVDPGPIDQLSMRAQQGQ